MEPYPHHYLVDIEAEPEGVVTVASRGLTALATAPPPQYGGPGDQWSPETLLVAAAADCFALTFRAVASASKLPWTTLHCDADGLLPGDELAGPLAGSRLRGRGGRDSVAGRMKARDSMATEPVWGRL